MTQDNEIDQNNAVLIQLNQVAKKVRDDTLEIAAIVAENHGASATVICAILNMRYEGRRP